METISKDLISLLQFLLPGFISAWVFYALTSYPKPSQFERVIEALIFTVIIQAMVHVIRALLAGRFYAVSVRSDTSQLIWSIPCAILFGLVFSYFANNDMLHALFRKLGVTRETSFPSEWFGAFLKNTTYVVLHLDDERRLYGWPLEWPSEPGSGHFLITDASWLTEEGEEILITGVENLLVDVRHVKWVEFMKKTWEEKHGQESIESPAAPTDSPDGGRTECESAFIQS